ncbi:hypothetical protein G7046_g7623 [Stylonectria norvegica]|nr:hypothetical protein G7046_g7623 [Stylonectria norvegica]
MDPTMVMSAPTTTTVGQSMTMTMAAAAETATEAAMDMGGMDACQISMLWNWNTIDACFISSSWRITSRGMFAGSCIGVVLLVMCLELLRRSVKEWDRYLVRQHLAKHEAAKDSSGAAVSNSSDSAAKEGGGVSAVACAPSSVPPFRPNVWQQAIRALLHVMQFAVAYFVMLLAMYYNGYIIICILIGAYLGAFIFQWETLTTSGLGSTSAAREATVCCG